MRSIVFFILLFHMHLGFSQGFHYQYVPDDLNIGIHISPLEKLQIISKAQGRIVEAEKYLPKHYVKDGSVDYTDYIQLAIEENFRVILPDFPLLINERGLSLDSDMVLYFRPNTKLILKPNNKKHYEILRIHDVENVEVYFPNIEGDKYTHIGEEGEWGMGISIRGARNVKIYGGVVSKCWGDGIYLGVTNKSKRNIDVSIANVILDDNRRNGMSIISSENLNVDNILVSNTFGTAPMAGIDIEPNHNTDVISKLTFNNIKTFNNKTFGMLFALNNLSGELIHKIDITVFGLETYKSDYGIGLKISDSNTNNKMPIGKINIIEPYFENIKIKNILSYKGNEYNKIRTNIFFSKGENIEPYIKDFKNYPNIKALKK